MSIALPPRPNLNWLKKTARQRLRDHRARDPEATLASVQFALAREYGFSSWRSLKSHVGAAERHASTGPHFPTDEEVAVFLDAVGAGRIEVVRSSLQSAPLLVNAVGPHPYWGGRPQPLHVSIETSRQDVFELLLSAGGDVDGKNDEYEHCSPLMLSIHWKRQRMQEELLARGARVGLVEALLMQDDVRVAKLLRAGKSALPKYQPNGGSILAMARTPFALDRLLELGVPRDLKDRWGASPVEALSRLGPRGFELVRHLQTRGVEVGPREYARMGDREGLQRLLDLDPPADALDQAGRHCIRQPGKGICGWRSS